MITISFPNYLFFARLFNQINDANRSIQCKFFTKMFFKCYLCFSLIYDIVILDYITFCANNLICKKYIFSCIYLYQFAVEAYIYIQVVTNILAHYLVLVQRILDDHGTKLIVQSRHNLHIFHRRPLHVSYICIMHLKLFIIIR